MYADTSLDQFEPACTCISFFRAVLLQYLQVGHAQVSFQQHTAL